MKLQAFIISAIFFVIISCSDKENGYFQVKGSVQNIDKILTQFPGMFANDSIKLFLYEVPFGGDSPPVQLDSVFVTSAKNTFVLRTKTAATGMYDVLIDKGPMIPLVNDVPELTVKIDLGNLEKYYTVSGSPASEQLRDFIFKYSEKSNSTNKAFRSLDSLKIYTSTDSLILAATNEKNKSLEELNAYLRNTLSNASQPTVAAFILGTASKSMPEKEFEAELNKLNTKYPSDPALKKLKKLNLTIAMHKLISRINNREKGKIWVGKKAPELILPDPNGKNIALSSYKGKYVLVDFWASWCRPCREENPNVVKAFDQFKNKNFTILGVSLDKEKKNWLQAIREDKLQWSHVSDLAFWDSKAVTIYQFQGIPFNVLLDPQGNVIGEGLRGDELLERLKEVLE